MGKGLAPHVGDASAGVEQALDWGGNVLLEGAQARALDVDHGTDPDVTASNPSAGGACVGAVAGPRDIGAVIGICKAYCTRVGSGPFPTEAGPAEAETLVEAGGEYGTTTGRKRRCGWFDAVAARYAARLNSLSEVVVTKLDVLSRFPSLKVCVAYEYEGERYDSFPAHQTVFNKCRPVYEELPGWSQPIERARSLADLPQRARAYLDTVESLLRTPISWVSVGPGRDQSVRLRETETLARA